MSELHYQIKTIPDLTLGKYEYLSQNGVDGVLELHKSFLWNLYDKSILTKVTFHLLYVYKSNNSPGEKIESYFIAKGPEEKLLNVDMILKAAPLSDYFSFVKIDANENSLYLQNSNFNYCNTICKEEVFFTGGDSRTYYDVPLWKSDDAGRLYAMFRMMDSLNEDVAFRIDLTATKKNRTLRKTLSSGPIPKLHSLQSSMGGERDYGADSVLKDYDELLKALDTTPHFQANIFVFSNNSENGSIILSSALTEAIEQGDYRLCSFKSNFNAKSFLDIDNSEHYDYSDELNTYVLENKNKGIRIYSQSLSDSNYLNLSYLSTLFTLDEISPLFRFPCLYDGETINMRKETVAPLVPDDNSLYLGLDENGYKINFPIKLLPKHAFVSGVPGSGKTNTMHHLVHSLWKGENKIPFLVFEPAKKEYRALCNLEDMKEVRLFSPSSNTSFPLHINPFEFAKGLSVAEHIRTLCSVFEGAFPLDNPMPFLLDKAIEEVYKDMGWRPETVYTDETDLKFPTVSMLYKKLEEELEQTTYSGEVKGNLESALKVRIGSLLRREMGDVFDVPKSTLSPEEWLTTPAVIELEAMGKGPGNFLTLMLCSLIRECLKINPNFEGDVRHVIFIEEAHNLIGPDSEEKTGEAADAKTAATAFIVKMLAEVRALKESVFIADQLPTAMAPEVIKNTGLKIALRLTAMDDRQLLCNSMSANSSQVEDMANFRVGDALVSYEGLQRPFKMRIHRWCSEVNDENLIKALTTPKNDIEVLKALVNQNTYRDSITRSSKVVFSKLNYEYQVLEDALNKASKLVDEYKKLKERTLEIKGLLIAYDDKCADILSEYPEDIDPDVVYLSNDEFKHYYDEYEKLTEELLEIEPKLCYKYVVSDDVADTIKNCIEYIVKVSRIKLYFKKLGVECSDNDAKLILEGNYANVDDAVRVVFFMRQLYMKHLKEKLLALQKKYDEVDFVTAAKSIKNKLSIFVNL